MRYSKGFSLLEILITLLLTTIGILGMVAMQGRALQYTQDSAQRNAAITLAAELTEIIRTNPGELFTKAPPKEPVYSGLKSSSLLLKAAGSDFSPAPAACVRATGGIPKTATEMRDCWIASVKDSLPGAADLLSSAFYICRSSAPNTCDGNGSMLEIQLAWTVKKGACSDSRAPNDTTCIYRTRVEL